MSMKHDKHTTESSTHLDGVHLVEGNNELSDTEGECEQSVLSGLAILGDTSLKLTNTGGDDENSAIGLGSTGNHVWGERSVSKQSGRN